MAGLRAIRESEGLSRTALARAAEVSERTLQRAEAGEAVTTVTRYKIMNALNRREQRLREYVMDDLFVS